MRACRPQALRRIARDREGTAAIEFAFVLPILVTLFLGSYEIANVLLADLKLMAATETAADLIAQTRVGAYLTTGTNATPPSDFDNITNAVAETMMPFPVGNKLQIAYASITFNTGTPVIDWHVERNGATPISLANLPNNQDLSTLANESVNSSDSLVIVSVTYNYTSPISYVLSSTYTLSKAVFNRPRYVNCVSTDQNTNDQCP